MKINKNLICIDGKKIGLGEKPYIVAEMSGNHNGDIRNALRILELAKECGADAVKIQTYTPDTITINHNSSEFILKEGLWAGRKLYDLYNEAHTPWHWHNELFEYAKKLNITLFSSPFDHSSIDFLEDLNCPAYKIASPELVDIPLIKKAASTCKPIIMSTGMANRDEISEAIDAARSYGNNNIIVLHCTASYPSTIEDANLSTITKIREEFNVNVGISDHTKGVIVPSLATTLGACLIEKHFTINKALGGVDSEFSIDSMELKELVEMTNQAFKSIGSPALKPLDSEKTVLGTRRSLYVVKKISKGEIFSEKNIKSSRPSNGLKPKYYEKILGKKASRDILFGEPLIEEMIEDFKTN